MPVGLEIKTAKEKRQSEIRFKIPNIQIAFDTCRDTQCWLGTGGGPLGRGGPPRDPQLVLPRIPGL